MIQAKKYTFTVGALLTYELAVAGDYFVVLSETGPVNVAGDTFGNMGALDAGQGLEDVAFTKLQFTDTTGAANKVTVLIAGDHFVNQRVMGDVSVIDGGKARTLAGNAFSGLAYAPVLAANFPYCQLWNPAGSTKNLIVGQVLVYNNVAAGAAIIKHSNAAATTLSGTAQSKKVGGASSTAELRVQNGAAGLFGFGIGSIAAPGAKTTAIYKITEPVVVPPGFGLIVTTDPAGADLSVTFEFNEELVT